MGSRKDPFMGRVENDARVFLFLGLLAGCGSEGGREVPLPDRDFSEHDASSISQRRQLVGTMHDRVDPYTGELVVRHVDARIPGNGGFDLELARVYASKARWSAHSPYGPGWRMEFGSVTGATNACDVHDEPETIGVALPDGGRVRLYRTDATPGARYLGRDRWSATCEGSLLFLHTPQGETWEMGSVSESNDGTPPDSLDQDKTTPVVEGTWQVLRKVDRNGNWIEFDYAIDAIDGAGVTASNGAAGRLVGIETSDGRVVELDYEEDNNGWPRLEYVVSHDGNGEPRVWKYDHTLRMGSGAGCIEFRYDGYGEAGGEGDGCGPEPATDFSQGLQITDPEGQSWSLRHCGDPLECDFVMVGPRGGETRYSFDHMVGYGPVVEDKRTYDDDDSLGRWHFAYDPSNPIGAVTWVWGPADTQLFVHYGEKTTTNGSAWKVGLLAERHVFPPQAGFQLPAEPVLERVVLDWGSQKISDVTLRARPPRGDYREDPDTHAELLMRRTVTRDGTEFVTDYGAHDAYGNPGAKDEVGPGGERHTVMTYFTDPARWIVAQLDDMSTEGEGTIYRDFDERGNVVHLNTYGVVTESTYHATGDLASMTDAAGRVTTFDDYFRGLPQATTRPDGSVVALGVNASGTVAAQTDGRGFTTQVHYDGLNRPVWVQPAAYAPSTIEYPDPRQERLTRGGMTEALYRDGFGRLVRRATEVDGRTIVVDYRYDAVGRRTFESHPYYADEPETAGQGTRWEYDALGRTVAVEHADGTRRRYDYRPGNIVATIDEDDHETVEYFASYGDPDQRYLVGRVSPENVATVIERNRLGQMLAVVQEYQGENLGRWRRFEYDDAHRMVRRFDPEVGWTDFEYDPAGNLVREQIEGQAAVQHEYDVRDRRIHTDYGDGEETSWTYDAESNLVSIVGAAATQTREYDAVGNVVGQRTEVGGHLLALDYDYDGLGHRQSMTYPSGREVTYAPDALGRPTAASPVLHGVTHHANGRPATLGFMGGVTTTVGENERRFVASRTTEGPAGTLLDLRYEGYDGRGNVGIVADAAQPDRDVALAYDGLSRLVAADGFWGSTELGYDGHGNLVERRRGAEVDAWSFGDTLQASALGHDGRGNITEAPGLVLEYDAANRLRHAQSASGAVDYDYGGDGWLVRQSNAGGPTTYYVHDEQGRWIGQYDAEGAPRREWVYLGRHKVGAMTPGADLALHVDAMGSTVGATDGAGQWLATEMYEPYGARRGLVDTGEDLTGGAWYAGNLEDPTTGLVYAGARWYSPQLGRFVGLDPADYDEQNVHSFSRYAYANNNPYAYVDPDGREGIAMEDPDFGGGWEGNGTGDGQAGSEAAAGAGSEVSDGPGEGVADGTTSDAPSPTASLDDQIASDLLGLPDGLMDWDPDTGTMLIDDGTQCTVTMARNTGTIRSVGTAEGLMIDALSSPLGSTLRGALSANTWGLTEALPGFRSVDVNRPDLYDAGWQVGFWAGNLSRAPIAGQIAEGYSIGMRIGLR